MKVAKRRGRPAGSKNKKKSVAVQKVAKKRGRPKGSKNNTTNTKSGKKSDAVSERFEKLHMIEDMFYSSTRTEEAKAEFSKAFPGEERYFVKEWRRVAGDVADLMLGKRPPLFTYTDND